MTSLLHAPSSVMQGRSDDAEGAKPVAFVSDQSIPYSTGEPTEYASTVVDHPAPRRVVSRVYLERMVEDYVEEAMRHVRTRQLPDGYWIADVVGLDGAWSDGKTEAEAIEVLPDIIFDWAMFKIADHDGDIPPLAGIDLNQF